MRAEIPVSPANPANLANAANPVNAAISANAADPVTLAKNSGREFGGGMSVFCQLQGMDADEPLTTAARQLKKEGGLSAPVPRSPIYTAGSGKSL